jgi:hypothetical protein
MNNLKKDKYTSAWRCSTKWYLFIILRPRKGVPWINSHLPLPTSPSSCYAPHYSVLPYILLEPSSHSVHGDVGSDNVHWPAACFCWFLAWITFWLGIRRRYISPKLRALSELHGTTAQKTRPFSWTLWVTNQQSRPNNSTHYQAKRVADLLNT